MGSRLGVLKTAAARIGISPDGYAARIAQGERWCAGCKVWHSAVAFGADRTQPDGLARTCLEMRKRRYKVRYVPRVAERHGPPPNPPRDGDKRQARARVNLQVKYGNRPNPNTLTCADCGHIGGDKRHEYDHYLGYAAEHHYAVQAVCTTCHHNREGQRHGR